MKILLLPGNYFRDNVNLGDIAIYRSIVRLMPADAEILLPTALAAPAAYLGSRIRGLTPPDLGASWPRAALDAAVADCAALAATGGSYFSDRFPAQALDVLNGLEAGIVAGKRTAVLGATFERLSTGPARDAARRTLPRVDLLWVRDEESRAVLVEWGVAPGAVRVAGDPALALRGDVVSVDGPTTVGVSLRDSPHYNPVPFELRQLVALAVRDVVAEARASVRGLRISLCGPDDRETIRSVLPEAAGMQDETDLDALLREVAACRTVVSGSHHAAVFALAQGKPVVTVAASAHYLRKMKSLSTLFGDFAPCIDLNRLDAGDRLSAALRRAMGMSDDERAPLRRIVDAKTQFAESLLSSFFGAGQ